MNIRERMLPAPPPPSAASCPLCGLPPLLMRNAITLLKGALPLLTPKVNPCSFTFTYDHLNQILVGLVIYNTLHIMFNIAVINH